MTADLGAQVEALHDHLVATREVPVERTASRWIGEAEAVAGDLVGADVPAAVVAARIAHVRSLLSNVDETGHAGADERVARAKRIAAEVLDRVEK